MSSAWGRLVLQLAVCVAGLSLWMDNAAFAQESRGDRVRGLSRSTSLRNIRITPHYDPSIERLSEEQQVLVKSVLINATLTWFRTVLKVQPDRSPLTFERSCAAKQRMVQYEEYCMGACSQATMCGPVHMPEEHLQPCRSCTHTNCTVLPGPRPVGVPDSDLVVYVSAIEDKTMCTSQFVFGGHCQQEAKLDRPIAAYLSFCPAFLLTNSDLYHLQITTVVQKMVQILAFAENLFPFFRDEQGRPLNQRQPNGLPRHSPMGNYVRDGTARYYRHTPWLVADHVRTEVDGVKGPPVHPVRMVITSNVVREVQDHFNCSDMIGGELESQTSPVDTNSFWEKRVFGEEVMTASSSYHPVLSRITLALLHDSGWYLPDYSYGGQLHWGRGMGCGFIEGSCYKWVWPERLNISREEQRTSPSPFCSRRQTGMETCVDQRRAVGVCNIKTYPAKLPEEYQYFSTARRGGAFPLADYCPLYQYDFHSSGRNCMTDPETPPILPEVYGQDSRCFEHEWVETTDNVMGEGERVGGGAGCYSYQCTRHQVLVSVGGEDIVCSHTGQKESVEYSLNNTTYTGHIVCPPYDQVCEGYDCPGRCSGRGSCDGGHCRCQPGYYGDDCSHSYLVNLLSCDDITCHNGASCVPMANGSQFGFTCQCPAHYTGMLCETEDPCHNVTCPGNRFCTWTGMETVGQCVCLPGYGGDDCSQLLLCEELGRPCEHGNCTLHRKNGRPMCVCEEGYHGPQCDQGDQPTDPCLSAPCLNGGTCSSATDDNGNLNYECSCTPGFKGRTCGNRKNPCVNPDPCLNGGRCRRIGDLDQWGQFYCLCPAGFTGQLCNTPI